MYVHVYIFNCFETARYLWDHRNESLRAFLVDTFIGGPDAMGNKNIDGLFLDDFW